MPACPVLLQWTLSKRSGCSPKLGQQPRSTIAGTPRKRDKLAAQFTWLANRYILGLPEDRRHGRTRPAILRLGSYFRAGSMSPAASSTSPSQAPRSQPISALISARRLPSVRLPVGSCATSRTESPSSSRACATRTSWKTTLPAGKRLRACAATGHGEAARA